MAFFVLLMLHLTAAHPAAQQSTRRLVLDEVRHQRLPDGFEAAGADMSSGETLLWASNQRYLLVWNRSGAVDTVRSESIGLPVGASFVAGGDIEVVDAEHRSIVRLGRHGGLLARSPIGTDIRFHGAVRGAAGWFVGGRDAAGMYHLLAVAGDGSTRTIYQMKTPGASARTPSPRLSRKGPDVLLTAVRAPFTIVRVDPSGRSSGLYEPGIPDSIAAAASGPSAATWVSLRALDLDDGLVQTISDLASDRRIFVTYGSPQDPPHHTLVDVPLGFVATDPPGRGLIAFRRVGSMEVVEYRWRWGVIGDNNQPE